MALKQNTGVGTNCRTKEGMKTTLKLIRVSLQAAIIFFILSFFCGQACADFAVEYVSSIAINGGSPGRLAYDTEGSIYVTVPAAGKVFKFSRNGSPSGVITVSPKPLSVAVDITGKVYVGDYMDGSVRVLGPNGQILYSLGRGKGEFRMPGDIAVSSSGFVYVTDSPNNVVKVYNSDGTFRSLFGGYGTGPGQMIFPTGIFSDDVNNEIYVVDQTNGRVEVFDSEGLFKRSFGSYGSGQGMLTRGQGIYVASGKVYVADAYLSIVEVFDTAGSFVSFIGGHGSGPGSLKMPMDVMIIGTTLYVANSDNARIEIFDVIDPQGLEISPLNLSFTAYDGADPLPQTILIDPKMEGMQVAWTVTASAPFGLKMSTQEGVAPAQVEVGIDAAGLSAGTYNGEMVFHAGGNDYPVTVGLVVSGPQVCSSITIAPSELPLGTLGVPYSQTLTQAGGTGTVTFSESGTLPLGMTFSSGSLSGTPSEAGVFPITITATGQNGCTGSTVMTLTVAALNVSVAPDSMDMFHQSAGDLAAEAVVIESSGGALKWTATTDAQWLSLNPSTGDTPAILTISLNSSVDTLSEGSYTAQVLVNAQNAANSPVSVLVTVKVIKAGSLVVTSNLEDTSFTMDGPTNADVPEVLVGYGMNWSTDELRPGTYTVHFDHIQGYRRPADRTLDIRTGETVSLDVQYMPLPVANVIVAGKGPDPKNDATIRVFDLNGGLITEFLAMDTKYGARVAMADIDGNGVDEIIVAPGDGPANEAFLKVFRLDGSLMTETLPVAGTNYGGSIAAGDIDGDGRAEVAFSIVHRNSTQAVLVYAFEGSALAERTKITLKEPAVYPAAIAFGDIDGDGWLELISLSFGKMTVSAFDYDLSAAYVVSTASPTRPMGILSDRLTVTAGDIDGDGPDEMLIGYGNGKDSMVQTVQVLGSKFAQVGPSIKAFEKGWVSPSICSMDIDGDGLAEHLAGQGAKASNNAEMRVFDSKGGKMLEIRAFDSKYGVNAAFGVISGVEGAEWGDNAK